MTLRFREFVGDELSSDFSSDPPSINKLYRSEMLWQVVSERKNRPRKSGVHQVTVENRRKHDRGRRRVRRSGAQGQEVEALLIARSGCEGFREETEQESSQVQALSE